MSKRICPVSGPGVLTESERRRKAKQLVAESGADSEETLAKSIASIDGTFRNQATAWIARMKKRSTAPSTIQTWESCVENWLNPNIGDLPLAH